MAENKNDKNKNIDQTSGKAEQNPRAHMSGEHVRNAPNIDTEKQPRGKVNDPQNDSTRGMSYKPSEQEKESLPGQKNKKANDSPGS